MVLVSTFNDIKFQIENSFIGNEFYLFFVRLSEFFVDRLVDGIFFTFAIKIMQLRHGIIQYIVRVNQILRIFMFFLN